MKWKNFSLGITIALSFAACNSNKSGEFESSSADTTGISSETTADLAQSASKLVKTADLDFRVKDVYRSNTEIQQKVKSFGGMIMHNDIQTVEIGSKTIPISDDSLQVISSYRVDARMTVRIPSESLTDFVASVASGATIIYSAKLDVDDRSIDYLGTKLKQGGRQNILDKQLDKDTLKTDDMLRLANEQEAVVDSRMSNLRTDASVRYSVISLHISQNDLLKKEILPDNNLSAYQQSFSKRIAAGLLSGLDIFVEIIIGISYILPFILLGLAGWAVFRYIQKQSKVKA